MKTPSTDRGSSPWYQRFARALAMLAMLVLGTAAASAATNPFTSTETYQKKLVCTTAGTPCKQVESTTYSASFLFTIPAADMAALNPQTNFDIRLGSVQISHRLSDDRAYKTGKTSAKFVATATNVLGKVVGTQTVTLKFKGTQVSGTVSGKITDLAASGWQSIRARELASRSAGNFQQTIAATAILGNNGYNFNIVATGKVTTKKSKGKDGVTYTLPTITFKGSTQGTPTVYVPPVHVTAGSDAPAASTTVGSSGGSLDVTSGPLAGLSMVIPPGALSGDTQLILASNDATMTPRSGTFAGHSVSIHTDGQTTFEEPLSITLPYNPAGGTIPVPYYVTPDGYLHACQIVSIDRVNGTITFHTFHASLFTWIDALVTGNWGGHTSYSPANDGFQITNYGSLYNRGGECFGMAAFAQWNFRSHGGGLYPKYMQDIAFNGGTVKGQNIVASRAHTSVGRLWNEYLPSVNRTLNLTGDELYSEVTNTLNNTACPTILYLSGSDGAHAVLAYDHIGSSSLSINDPNSPGSAREASLSGGTLQYGSWSQIAMIGDGSFRTEMFSNIYQDAENDFNGNGAAQVSVDSHTDGEHVTDRTITLSGGVTSGLVLVDQLIVWLNGTTRFEVAVSMDGSFSIPINLVSGENRFTFQTRGIDSHNNRIGVMNTQKGAFVVNLDTNLSQVLVTLSWNTNNTDIDLYTIDPTGDYSAYYHHMTEDGGELDYDNTSGYGPEHWTLEGSDTVRWGQTYNVRVHYYSDHNWGSETTLPTRWNVNVLLYEGTPRAASYNFSGILSYESSSNDDETDSGPDWADVCTIVPVQQNPGGLVAPQLDLSGKQPRLLVPVSTSK